MNQSFILTGIKFAVPFAESLSYHRKAAPNGNVLISYMKYTVEKGINRLPIQQASPADKKRPT